MAVEIQKTLDARAAGVIFTVPVTGYRSCISIKACYGLGFRVVF
ncbi:MAG: PEP/pyruvate-binding domain-containing protein [Burkholderiaceae bacterium]|nr:PEP/pyruvate-binding domain-containing protein [Burkholderiaceae bacterium]